MQRNIEIENYVRVEMSYFIYINITLIIALYKK